MEIIVEDITSLTDERIEYLATWYSESDYVEDKRYSKETYIYDLQTYRVRERSAALYGYIDDQLVATAFVLNLTTSRFIQGPKNQEILNYLNEKNLTLDECYITGNFFVHLDHRGKNLGRIIKDRSHLVAKDLGYTHILRFGYFNSNLKSYIDYNYPTDETNINRNLTCHNGYEVSILPI